MNTVKMKRIKVSSPVRLKSEDEVRAARKNVGLREDFADFTLSQGKELSIAKFESTHRDSVSGENVNLYRLQGGEVVIIPNENAYDHPLSIYEVLIPQTAFVEV